MVKFGPLIFDKFQTSREYKLLRRRVGAELYTQSDLINATEFYVEPDCQSIDPAGLESFRNTIALRLSAHKTLVNLLDFASDQRFTILLADSGMGKTTVLLNFYAKYSRKSRRRYQIVLIPLGDPRADGFIRTVADKSNTILFLDAFDEDTKAIKDYKERISEIIEISKDFGRVLMTCRTQFFESDSEIPTETGVVRIGITRAGQSKTFSFSKLYLSPFSEEQIASYVRIRFPFWQYKKKKTAGSIITSVPDLTARPLLLAYISDLMQTKCPLNHRVQLYDAIIEGWLVRESKFVDIDNLRRFSLVLAVDIYSKREQRGSERIPASEAIQLAKAQAIPLQDWQLRGRSLLNRDAEGRLKFSHRSILEYFYVVAFLKDPCTSPRTPWTDQMKEFWWEMVTVRYGYGASGDSQIVVDLQNGRVYGDVSNFWKTRPERIVYKIGMSTLLENNLRDFSIIDENHLPQKVGPFLLERISNRNLILNNLEPDTLCENFVIDYALGLIWEDKCRSFDQLSQFSVFQSTSSYLGWRLPTPLEALSLKSEDNSERGRGSYPACLFDNWAEQICTQTRLENKKHQLGVFSYLDGSLKPRTAFGEATVRLVRSYNGLNWAE